MGDQFTLKFKDPSKKPRFEQIWGEMVDDPLSSFIIQTASKDSITFDKSKISPDEVEEILGQIWTKDMYMIKEMNAGGVPGFQIPMSIKKRKGKIDELLKNTPDINEAHVLSFMGSLDEPQGEEVGCDLDCGNFDKVSDQIRTHMVRQLAQKAVKEVVRKKEGGGGFVLYSPNQGKKKQAKPVGNFPTKLAAKKAELARYPPKDPAKRDRLRKEVDRLLKDPKKRAEKEKAAQKQKGTDDSVAKNAHPKPEKTKKESLQLEMNERRLDFMHRRVISKVIRESLFQEEVGGSEWDEFIGKLSNQALGSDGKFQRLQKNIEKKTQKVLDDAFATIRKAVDRNVKLKSFGVKKDANLGKTYLAFSAHIDEAEVAPVYIYADNGIPKIEMSSNAKVGLTKADPDSAKLFRAELITVQERVLDNEEELVDAIQARDTYLGKVEAEVDAFVAGLTPLQISLLKQLLVKKYRKLQ